MNILAKPRMIRVAVISPYNGGTNEATASNVVRALSLGRHLLSNGVMPLIPHVYFTAMLNDTVAEEREYGLRLSAEWLADADLFLVDTIDGTLTEGMQNDLRIAESLVSQARIFTNVDELINFIHKGPSTDDTEQTGQQEEASTSDM